MDKKEDLGVTQDTIDVTQFTTSQLETALSYISYKYQDPINLLPLRNLITKIGGKLEYHIRDRYPFFDHPLFENRTTLTLNSKTHPKGLNLKIEIYGDIKVTCSCNYIRASKRCKNHFNQFYTHIERLHITKGDHYEEWIHIPTGLKILYTTLDKLKVLSICNGDHRDSWCLSSPWEINQQPNN